MATATAKKIRMRPLDDRVVLEPSDPEEMTAGGIVLWSKKALGVWPVGCQYGKSGGPSKVTTGGRPTTHVSFPTVHRATFCSTDSTTMTVRDVPSLLKPSVPNAEPGNIAPSGCLSSSPYLGTVGLGEATLRL